MKSLGLCIGASSIGYVLLKKNNGRIEILEEKSLLHGGNPREVIKNIIDRDLLDSLDRIAVTGRKLRNMLTTSSIPEPEAVEYAFHHIKENYPAQIIISAGGESMMVYRVDTGGKIIDVTTGNKCASGTGEFFLQQIKRINLNTEDVEKMVNTDSPYKVSGRCSVFCKSDCTHALNKGQSKESVVSGLCEMMAKKIIELLEKAEQKNKSGTKSRVLLIGGSFRNRIMVNFLKKMVPELVIPPYAGNFEALGTALWGLENETKPILHVKQLFKEGSSPFTFLPPLKNSYSKVFFREAQNAKISAGENLILGLDVGSTTTKAVLINAAAPAGNTEILASVYLRTNGNPIEASRQCYAALHKQVPPGIKLMGLGVTGSGRQIAGLHALTKNIINEIIAHANAAVYFDPKVDTIFEIGGQDAKYTFLTNGVASDYAMNEACSAGTGSFLEEAAGESFNIKTEDIGGIALKSTRPANFNDQCAAFINSDIKSAIQEGIPHEDIIAGVINSICVNYYNRVKGNRPVGNRVFMQGGVCYNKAVPVAMAAFTGKEIIVPPDPGLMGAFGVALYVKNRLEKGLCQPESFELAELAGREVTYKEPFQCAGGKEKCDLKCQVSRIVIKGKTYPFGGACNKYYNLLSDKEELDLNKLDLVQLREQMVFKTFSTERASRILPENGIKLGINRSLLTNTYYPLYYNFFTALGYDVVTSEEIDPEGVHRQGSAFCYPVEISHGALGSLLKTKPEIIFMPNIKSVYLEKKHDVCVTCPFVHSESYYLLSAFPELAQKTVLNPVFDFVGGYKGQKKVFMEMGKQLNHRTGDLEKAFALALKAQNDFHAACQKAGKMALEELDQEPDKTGVVLFGRPYNAFTRMANKGIPRKFATRGYRIIPADFLPYGDMEPPEHIYWGIGELNLRAAKIVKQNPRLFGTYITNFSCGPDSFLVSFFRKEMGHKPSLTLELDNHVADAGIDTRIEAFVDVVKTFRKVYALEKAVEETSFRIARCEIHTNSIKVIDSAGKKYKLNDPHVHIIFPSMMDLCSRAAAATLKRAGIRASAVPDPTEEDLKWGQAYTTGKECLPAIITTGSLFKYLNSRVDDNELVVYFIPGDSGPCRFGSYYLLMQNMMEKEQIRDVAFLSLSQAHGYIGFKPGILLRFWQSILITDIMEEIYGALLVLAKNKTEALEVFSGVCNDLVESLGRDSWSDVVRCVEKGADRLGKIGKKMSLDDAPKISLINEMYVRRNNLARQNLVEKMAAKGIVVRVAPLTEWLFYIDYAVQNKLEQHATLSHRLIKNFELVFKRSYEKRIKNILATTGFYHHHIIDPAKIINSSAGLITQGLICESIIVIGTTFSEIAEEVAGVISILPFGCMPGRIAEAIINDKMREKKPEVAKNPDLVKQVMEKYPHLPFLSLEVDGKAFPPATEAQLEIFCLQVERVHKRMLEVRKKKTPVLSPESSAPERRPGQ